MFLDFKPLAKPQLFPNKFTFILIVFWRAIKMNVRLRAPEQPASDIYPLWCCGYQFNRPFRAIYRRLRLATLCGENCSWELPENTCCQPLFLVTKLYVTFCLKVKVPLNCKRRQPFWGATIWNWSKSRI